jgi:4-hydroxybutyrate dehydrogenase
VISPTLSYINDVYVGSGTADCVPMLASRYGITRPLVVTDSGLRALGFVERARLGHFPIYDGVETNPSESSVLAGLSAYREFGCDGLLALGGGSPIDLAKAVALALNHPEPLSQYALLNNGPASIVHDVPPVLAIPTTAGSGSEVGRAALITVADGRKLGFLSPKLAPVAAVCDPVLTSMMPKTLAAATGMDAISHCVEALLSPRKNPVAERLAFDGLQRGSRALRRVVLDSDTKDEKGSAARENMIWCSLMGGMAFQKGLGAVHCLSHPLGRFEKKRLHHGTLNGLFLPAVLEYNASSHPEGMRQVSEAVGGVDPVAFFCDLLDTIGLPRTLSELGVTEDDILSSAPLAAADHCAATNPRHLGEEEALALYRGCL